MNPGYLYLADAAGVEIDGTRRAVNYAMTPQMRRLDDTIDVDIDIEPSPQSWHGPVGASAVVLVDASTGARIVESRLTSPVSRNDGEGYHFCFYCDVANGGPDDHRDDCLWLIARRWLDDQ